MSARKNLNPSKSVNKVIWSRLPKTELVALSTVEFGMYGIIHFDEGNIYRCFVIGWDHCQQEHYISFGRAR